MRTRAAALGLVAALFLAGCGDDGDGGGSASQTTVAPTTSTILSQAQLDEAKATRIVLTVAGLPGFTMDAPDPTDTSTLGSDAAAVAELDTITLGTQFPAAERLRLATVLADRMAAP